MIPRRAGRYQLIREIARGGMGVVFEGVDPTTGRRVAIKALLGGLEGEEAVERFMQEARVGAELRHPNLVSVLEVGREGGQPFIVLDYASGGSLLDRLKAQGPLPEAEAIRIGLAIARGLAHAHARSILHRDVKPHNVLFEDGAPLLTDFGIARVDDQRLTRTGQMLGTPDYMSPEQVEGTRDAVDARSDVYGLGATLFHALCGRPPFVGSTSINVIAAVIGKPPPDPCSLRPELSPRLAGVVLRCLAKDPDDRYPDCDALIEDLLLAEAPPVRRSRRGLLAAGGLVALLGLVAVAAAVGGGASPPDGTAPEPTEAGPLRLEEPTSGPPREAAPEPPTPTPAPPWPEGWTRVRSTLPPTTSHTLATDTARKRIVAYGGHHRLPGGVRAYRGVIFEWDGESWARVNPLSNRPLSGRARHVMAYDAAREVCVVFGGSISDEVRAVRDTWLWDGRDWREARPEVRPPGREYTAMAYDAERERVVLFGGRDKAERNLGDTWLWDGTTWTEAHPATQPSPRRSHAMAFDAARNEVVLFGGLGKGGTLGETWVWNGDTWARREPEVSPSPRRNPNGMAWDPLRKAVVLHGGDVGNRAIAETWSWDGRTWTRRLERDHPEKGHWAPLAFDPVRGKMVQFGGNRGLRKAPPPVNEQWEY